MRDIDVVLAVIGGLVLFLGLFSELIKRRTGFSVPLVAVLVGILLGPHVSDVLDLSDWGDQELILEEAARATLAIGLMAIALRLPPRYLVDQWRTLLTLICLVMPAMWIVSGVLSFFILETTLLVGTLIGAIITPTDPVVASSIVTSNIAREKLPPRIRHALSGESGLNDGLALLFVMLPLMWLAQGAGDTAAHWLRDVLLHQVIGGTAVGIAAGWASGRMLVWAERHHAIERASFLSYTVALALLTVGLARLLGTADILAVFVCGVAFDGVVGGSDRAEEADIQDTVNQFFTLPAFALIGLAAPLSDWLVLSWRGLVLAAGILLLRRLPAVLLAAPLLPSLRGRLDLLFLGWFGPIGISAMLYAVMAARHTGLDLWPITSLIICASVAVHGITSTPFVKAYERHSRAAGSTQPAG